MHPISAGGSAKWPVPHMRCIVSRGGNSPHKLPGVAGILLGNQGIQEDLVQYNSHAAVRQHNSSELHKPERGHSVKSFVPTSDNDLVLVYRTKYYSPSRAPSWPTEFSSRPRIQDSEGSLQLEVEAISIPSNSGNSGPSGSGPVCITPDEAASPLLQLETRPKSRSNRCLHAELGNLLGICQSSMVPDTSLPDQGEKTGSEDSANNAIVENPVMVSTSFGTFGGLPPQDSSASRSDINDIGTGVSYATRNTQLVAWPISGNPSRHKVFLQKL